MSLMSLMSLMRLTRKVHVEGNEGVTGQPKGHPSSGKCRKLESRAEGGSTEARSANLPDHEPRTHDVVRLVHDAQIDVPGTARNPRRPFVAKAFTTKIVHISRDHEIVQRKRLKNGHSKVERVETLTRRSLTKLSESDPHEGIPEGQPRRPSFERQPAPIHLVPSTIKTSRNKSPKSDARRIPIKSGGIVRDPRKRPSHRSRPSPKMKHPRLPVQRTRE